MARSRLHLSFLSVAALGVVACETVGTEVARGKGGDGQSTASSGAEAPPPPPRGEGSAAPSVKADRTPARLASTDGVAMAGLVTSLADATGRRTIELGPEDLATSTNISVLPPRPGPLETRSLAMPTVFDFVMVDGVCALSERSSGELYPLTGVMCQPAG